MGKFRPQFQNELAADAEISASGGMGVSATSAASGSVADAGYPGRLECSITRPTSLSAAGGVTCSPRCHETTQCPAETNEPISLAELLASDSPWHEVQVPSEIWEVAEV